MGRRENRDRSRRCSSGATGAVSCDGGPLGGRELVRSGVGSDRDAVSGRLSVCFGLCDDEVLTWVVVRGVAAGAPRMPGGHAIAIQLMVIAAPVTAAPDVVS